MLEEASDCPLVATDLGELLVSERDFAYLPLGNFEIQLGYRGLVDYVHVLIATLVKLVKTFDKENRG